MDGLQIAARSPVPLKSDTIFEDTFDEGVQERFSKGCAMAATAVSTAGICQVIGEHIDTSKKHPVPSIQDTETSAQKNEPMKRFREARFGMFIHWGLYAIPARRWNGKQIPG
jgi:alpha-L-fucosidase